MGLEQSWALAVILNIYAMENSIKWICLWVGCLNRLDPEIASFYNDIGLEVTFWTTLQNRKPQMSSTG